LIRRILCAVVCVLLVARLAAALEVQVKNLHAPASVVTTTIELRDVLPDRFKKTLEGGGILHLRVQAELWESRPVWDRLVYPAIVRVFRFTRGATDGLSITDPSGATTTYPAPPRSVPVIVDLGDTRRLTATERYYVHVIATLGTLAEREVNEVGDAVFGRESETNSLGSLAKLVFRTVLQVSDYLQTVSAETRSRRTAGADMLKPASIEHCCRDHEDAKNTKTHEEKPTSGRSKDRPLREAALRRSKGNRENHERHETHEKDSSLPCVLCVQDNHCTVTILVARTL
jgi:hypothetical protein